MNTTTTTTSKSLPAELVAWFESRGYNVDAQTGKVSRPQPAPSSQAANIPAWQLPYLRGDAIYARLRQRGA